jgi:hypothetical protein
MTEIKVSDMTRHKLEQEVLLLRDQQAVHVGWLRMIVTDGTLKNEEEIRGFAKKCLEHLATDST